jgi:hypothetical protein
MPGISMQVQPLVSLLEAILRALYPEAPGDKTFSVLWRHAYDAEPCPFLSVNDDGLRLVQDVRNDRTHIDFDRKGPAALRCLDARNFALLAILDLLPDVRRDRPDVAHTILFSPPE